MANIDNIITGSSYTSKDFNSIWEELLSLAKNLSSRWDPSQSNESDPGVVLLKMCALIADKNNYNIDKQVLECFPSSVSQPNNARELYNSLGYRMKWYQAATCGLEAEDGIEIQVANEDIFEGSRSSFDVPAFKMISDDSGEIVYTLLNKMTFSKGISGRTVRVPAIQGTWKQYRINGEPLITSSNLDDRFRLYFEDSNIAENGIFISDASSSSSADTAVYNNYGSSSGWSLVENIESYPSSNKVYSFGVADDGKTCYIQFPEDISILAPSGLYIRYINTLGLSGNVKRHTLTKFTEDIAIGEGDSQVVINEYVHINQPKNITNGEDVESISDAYKNYRKSVGTFNTLITRRDYENFIYNAKIENRKIASNSVVSDCTNDYNATVSVKEWGTSLGNNTILRDGITYSDVVMYLLESVENFTTQADYDKSFEPNKTTEITDITALVDEIKAVQQSLKFPTEIWDDESKNIIFNFTNLYRINAVLSTVHSVSEEDSNDIIDNVKQALYEKFNSSQLTYGEQLVQSDIVSVMREADNRLKDVVITEFSYSPYYTHGLDIDGYTNWELSPVNAVIDNAPSVEDEMVAKMILNGTVQPFKHLDGYDFKFGEVGDVNNVLETDIIKGESIITLSNSSSYRVRENEVIQLYSTSYIVTKQYSVNTRVTSTINIGEDEMRELHGTESVVIRYRDGTTGNPVEVRYGAGTVIQCTVPLVANVEKTMNTGDSFNVLELSESTFNAGTRYLYVSNSDSDLVIAQNSSHLLKDDEYLIIPNETLTEVVIWGSGKELVNNGLTNVVLHHSILDISKVTEQDLDNFDWSKLDANVVGVDTEIVSLGKGVTVGISGGPIDGLVLDSEFKPLSVQGESGYDITLTYRDGERTVNIQSDTRSWQIRSLLNIVSSKTLPQKLLIGQTVSVEGTNISGGDPNTPGSDDNNVYIVFDVPVVMTGDIERSAKELNISSYYTFKKKNYIDSSDIYYTLAKIEVSNYVKGRVYWYQSGNDWISFELGKFGTEVHKKSESGYEVVTGEDYPSSLYKKLDGDVYAKLYSMSSRQLDLTRYDAKKLVLTYNKFFNLNTDGTKYTAINTFKLPFKFYNQEQSNDMQWLVPVRFSSDGSSPGTAGATISVYTGGSIGKYWAEGSGTSTDVNDTAILQVKTADNYAYITVKVVGGSVEIGNITKLNGLNSDEIDYSSNTWRYTFNDHVNNILDKVEELGDGKYDWTYNVLKEDKVLYPTVPNSYWNPNHICNRLILPKIDFSNSSITINPYNLV